MDPSPADFLTPSALALILDVSKADKAQVVVGANVAAYRFDPVDWAEVRQRERLSPDRRTPTMLGPVVGTTGVADHRATGRKAGYCRELGHKGA